MIEQVLKEESCYTCKRKLKVCVDPLMARCLWARDANDGDTNDRRSFGGTDSFSLEFTQSLFVPSSQEDASTQSCIYSCSPLNVVDLIVDIMFIIDILINFRCDITHIKAIQKKQQ